MSSFDAKEDKSNSDGTKQPKPDIGSLALAERMELLLINEKAYDTVFIVGDKVKGTVERIPAISCLLIAASEVFQAMFTWDLPRPKEERVPDAEPEAFRVMLRYIYTEKIDVELDYALPLLYLAKKYMLRKLSNEVVERISKLLNAQNVCDLLQSAGLAEEIREM
ncbi:BTB/POZ domain-containing protein 6-A [Aphelenchoides avenae]|nr:BTB/POZ domain-containing protein 6-A [Aphelenchus avenae]